MAVNILSGDDGACFYCSTTDWCFGPLMKSREEAEGFLRWLILDPRQFDDAGLEKRYFDFKNLTDEQKHTSDLCEVMGLEYSCKFCKAENKDAE